MGIIQNIISYLEYLSTKITVELFTFFGAFLEELIAPIPSPVVMTLAGSIISTQGKLIYYLVLLAVVGAIGKSIGAYLIYLIANKSEDVVFGKFGKFIGVSHKEVEKIGAHFSGKESDFWLIFLLRALPIMPTAPISFISGLIKINLKKYLFYSFLGLLPRNLFYLALGYFGHEAYGDLLKGLDSIESIMQVLIGLLLFIAGIWVYFKKKRDDPFEWIKKRFLKG